MNSLASLTLTYRFPLSIFCSWRRVIDEPIEAQKKFSVAIEGTFKALEVSVHHTKKPEDILIIEKILKASYIEKNVHIFLLSPRLWSKRLVVDNRAEKRKLAMFGGTKPNELMTIPYFTRYHAIQAIIKHISDNVALISNIGFPSREL